MLFTDRVKSAIRNVEGYPKPGIVFRDITPVLGDPSLVKDIVAEMVRRFHDKEINVIAAIEARGFILGSILAHQLGCSFVPIRKAGRLPFKTHRQAYGLEYGTAEIEVHSDAILPGARVLIHDDLLATGGTAVAAAQLIKRLGGTVAGFSFLINLSFLPGEQIIHEQFGQAPDFLIKY